MDSWFALSNGPVFDSNLYLDENPNSPKANHGNFFKNSEENFDFDWLLGDEPFPPGSEPGELGELRGRLLFLLETSKHYQAQHLLTHFPECKLSFSSLCIKQVYFYVKTHNKTKESKTQKLHTKDALDGVGSRQNCRAVQRSRAYRCRQKYRCRL